MDRITREELESLALRQEQPGVSVYSRLEGTWPQTQGDALRFRGLLLQAQQELQGQGLSEDDARELLRPGLELTERSEFWQTSGARTLAAFLASPADGASPFLAYRLPYEVMESVDVGERFHVTPLVRLWDRDVRFLLLALSLNGIRLYECDPRQINAATLPAGIPQSLDEYLQGTEIGRPIRFATSAPTTRGAGGDQVGLVHGQTSYQDDHKVRVAEYVSHLGKEFLNLLTRRRLPLVVAGVEHLQAVFREACPSRFLVAEGISGSPEKLTANELLEPAVPLVWAWRERRFAEFNGQFRTRMAHGRASEQLETIVLAAREGRVDALVFAHGLRAWGIDDPVNQLVSVHPEKQTGDVDLLDVAVRETLSHGGDVHAVDPEEMPDGATAAAVLRW